MAETEKPAMSRYYLNSLPMKKVKSFKSLVNKMEQLKETEKGKLKGGISVVGSLKLEPDDNTNNGACSAVNGWFMCWVDK